MKRILQTLLVAGGCAMPGLSPAGTAGAPSAAPESADLWSVDFQTGVLWRVSDNTSADYVVLPQIISLRTPQHIRIELGDCELTVRSRFSLLIEPIIEGPESIYLGFSFSPSIELWNAARTTCLYLGAGGGAGTIDSTGEPGGQGQDFTLNWFAEAGVRWYLRPDLAVHAGAFFQHWSNGGRTDPNPGLDALGPVIGVSWQF